MNKAALSVAVLLTIAGCSSQVARSTPANAHILNVGDLNTEQILAAAATDAALKALDGTLPANAPHVVDQDLSDPTFKQVIDASVEHDRQVEKKEMSWLARYAR